MTDILDITGPFFFPWETLILAVGGLLLGGAVLWVILSLLKKRGAYGLKADQQSPFEEAMDELKKLSQENWIEEGEFRKYYFRLSEIFRRYLSRRFGLSALDYTTDEIVAIIQPMHEISAPQKEEAGHFLKGADLSKFAGFRPEVLQVKTDTDRVKSFVLATRQEESKL